jgi:transketolase
MPHLTEDKKEHIAQMANDIRQSIISMLLTAGSGHTAGPLGMADMFALLYFHDMNHRPDEPQWDDRDRVVLSNGHICPVLYATMAHAGYFPVEELGTLRKFGSRLQGHPHREFLPALETSSGPLASGLSQIVGMALADRIDRGPESSRRFICLMSDGEQESGQIWEAGMLAGKERLRNVVGIIDRNNIQIDGYTEDVMPLEPLADKWRAWNWHVLEVDGHNFDAMNDALLEARAVFEKPTMIILRTIPGKGVAEFERKYEWHGKPPNKEEAEMALKELRSLSGQVPSGYHHD